MEVVEQPDDTPATEAEANYGVREFRSELAADTVVLDSGLSLERRPDAISLDYLTCYTMGPVQVGDFSAGPVDRPWRIRAVGNVVYRSRLNDARTDFEDDVELFRFTGVVPTEIDAAFDQAARVLICMERASGSGGQSELWIYYYDPFAADYILTKFGVGRTPRAVLDDAQDSVNADILVFYMNDAVGMCYRMQRDRYATEYIVTGTVPVAVDTTGMNVVGPVLWNYPGPADSLSGYSGYTSAVGAGVTLRSSLGNSAPGIYSPLPNAKFSGYLDRSVLHAGEGGLGIVPGGGFEITFSTLVNFVEIVMNDSTFDGAVMVARDVNYNELGRHTFTKTVAGADQLAQLAFAGIKYLNVSASATDTTTWKNLRYSADPLPVVGPDVWPPSPLIFLEDVYRSTDRRVNVLYSVHDPVTGTYELRSKSTVLYPVNLDVDSWQMLQTLPQLSDLHRVLLYAMQTGGLTPEGVAPDAFLDIDNWQMFQVLPQSGIIVAPVITHTLYDVDAFQMFTALPQSGLLPVVIIVHTLYDIDSFQMLPALPQSGTITLVVIVHTLYDIDSWQMLATLPQSGTLA